MNTADYTRMVQERTRLETKRLAEASERMADVWTRYEIAEEQRRKADSDLHAATLNRACRR